ncbi:MAG TPA: L-ribulose-5-phosphate 4-epimerase AraD [Acidimicrobiales bacterium]|nr:L-ribulose-5-phosphate 4-epimerase AraD [Acidimicrobiales bacterium]
MNIRPGLREEVLRANRGLVEHGLVTLTWGNASGIDRDSGLIAIKPSGVPYEDMVEDDIVVVDTTGRVIGGTRRPSTDTPTHLWLYRTFPEIGGIIHTHSTWATSWAQAEREIPTFGTTHADLCPGPIPVTRKLTPAEVRGEYEENTGAVLGEVIAGHGIERVPGALVAGHGPFTWGETVAQALERAVSIEEVARMAFLTVMLRPDAAPVSAEVVDRHFGRKHGPGAYYGQT